MGSMGTLLVALAAARRRLRLAIAAAALASIATAATAQQARTPPDLPSIAGSSWWPVPPAIPAGGCVWNNAVFSDGAILQWPEQPRAFFRCVRGRWQSFESFDAAASGRAPAAQPPAR